MDLVIKKENGIVFVHTKGRLDAVSAPEFEKKLDDMISGGNSKFVVNLSDLEYISSAGLRSILILAKRLKSENGKMVFCGLVGPVAEVFKISGFFSIFSVFADEEEALKNM